MIDVGSVLTLSLLGAVLVKLTPILLAAIGGAITQQGDILNISMEGMMLVGGFSAVVVGSSSRVWAGDNAPWVGVVAAVLSALLMSALYAVCALWLKADYLVVGIGINVLALGVTVFGLQILYGNPGATPPAASISLPRIEADWFGAIPVLGDALNNQTPIVWLALLSVPVFAWVLYRTRYGVHLRAVGEDLPAATAAGINGIKVKFISILACGFLCGLAGAQLSMGSLGSFVANMTAGRGFIAVAALTFGRAKPVPTFIAALVFGVADAIADRLNVAGFNSNIALMIPYIITIVVLTIAAMDIVGRRRRRAAAAAAVRG